MSAVRSVVALAVCGVALAVTVTTSAQQAPGPNVADKQGPQTPGAQGQRGGGGGGGRGGRGGPAGPVGPARQSAPGVSLTPF